MRDGLVAETRSLLFVPKNACQSFLEAFRSIAACLFALMILNPARTKMFLVKHLRPCCGRWIRALVSGLSGYFQQEEGNARFSSK
jgi:hypothetical protein